MGLSVQQQLHNAAGVAAAALIACKLIASGSVGIAWVSFSLAGSSAVNLSGDRSGLKSLSRIMPHRSAYH